MASLQFNRPETQINNQEGQRDFVKINTDAMISQFMCQPRSGWDF